MSLLLGSFIPFSSSELTFRGNRIQVMYFYFGI